MVENVIQIKSDLRNFVNVSSKIKKNMCQRYYIWNPSTCTCENGKYLGSIIGDSVITCDKVIEVTKNYFNKNCSNKF